MIFILISIGILLVLLNIKAIKKQENSFSSILKREEATTNRDYDTHIISIRKDLAESILDIQKEMQQIKQTIVDISSDNEILKKRLIKGEEKIQVYDNINNDVIDSSNYLVENLVKNAVLVEDKEVISEIDFKKIKDKNSKVEEVIECFKDGLTDEEICKKMLIGKGEVLLIRGLFKK